MWVVKVDSAGNILWDKRFGGLSWDAVFQIQQTYDGGYILGGQSSSDSGGDKSQNSWGGNDYWIVKIDSLGNKTWDKCFGGADEEDFSAIQQTKDSGFILAGFSYSGISGDKTQDNWDTTYSTSDYWIVKTDKYGNMQWDRRFGGTGQDDMYEFSLTATNDGGYVIGGVSSSDISGDKTQANWAVGGYNFWVLRIDSVGNKLWDHVYGGTAEDDLTANILATQDGGFLLGGFSLSAASGDKTDSAWGGYWIVKIDSVGNKLWDKSYGGTDGASNLYSMFLTNDGGYLFGGSSSANATGDKSENNLGATQIWLVKTDSAGNQQWDKTLFTDSMIDNVYGIQTSEGCYVAGCATESSIGGYKTQPNWDITNTTDDYWIIKFCNEPTGINEITPKLQFNAYPNPFTNELDITLSQTNLTQADFSICNLLGQTVYTQHETNLSPTYTKMLDLSYLPNGVYLVEVVVDGEVSVKEVIKQ